MKLASEEHFVIVHGVTSTESIYARETLWMLSLHLQVCGFMHGYFWLEYLTKIIYFGHLFILWKFYLSLWCAWCSFFVLHFFLYSRLQLQLMLPCNELLKDTSSSSRSAVHGHYTVQSRIASTTYACKRVVCSITSSWKFQYNWLTIETKWKQWTHISHWQVVSANIVTDLQFL